MSVYHLHAWCSGRPEEVTDPMELEPPMVVSCRVVLGMELGTWSHYCSLLCFLPVPYLAFQDCLSVTWS